VDLKEAVYVLDTTKIDLCLTVFSWAPFRSTKAAVKVHTLLDLRGNIPAFIHISDGKIHEVNILDQLQPEPGAFYVMDRGFLDFERLVRFHEAGSFFVTRGKSNLKVQRRSVTELYRCRWQVELFFKWIKQHLRIKQFYGTSENAVKTQIWTAVTVYVLVAIVKKRLNITASPNEMLQILSLTMYEQTPLNTLLSQIHVVPNDGDFANQLKLFN
jgi:IS4 transposase